MMDTWSDSSRSEKEVIEHFSGFDLLVIDEYGLHDRHENVWRWYIRFYIAVTTT